jgi:signal transduction histidine kinase
MEVQRLTRDEADRKFPVELEGVATWISDDFRSFLIQDFTRAVFVWVGENSPVELPRVGDYCKVLGTSRSADFSPVVDLRSVTVLWKGQMPQPINPTRDQLLSGSLDAQYVEIRGLVIATHDTVLDVLTADGILSLDVSPAPDERWKTFLNSIIRIRGCLFAIWDPNTHRIILDQPIRLRTVTVSIETPPPADLFEADRVTALDLMQFDVRFDTFRRVKVAGQIVHCGPDMNYLMDGATGLRFRLVEPMPIDPGDVVEVVGLVEPGGASPVLRQAIARKTGHLKLPEPRPLNLNSLSNNYDSTLVSVECTLVDVQEHDSAQILELQVGVKNFVARLDSSERPHTSWDVGSRLMLKGTFCALDGDRWKSHEVNSFEILLNSPADVQVVARPPWWTLNRLLFAVACLMLGLSVAFVWITVLRRQVERRTRQLEREITERERAEKMRAIEQERSRIARDLHDDLGSTLTEISMMATVRSGLHVGPEIADDRLREIAEKSRSMVSALDGVVWVVNSKNDTLSALVEYLASYAEEFLGKAQVGCRIELPKDYGDRVVSAEIRQDVMLAVREALNNAVKHGQPTEVRLRLTIAGDNLEILIQDDGAGFDPGKVKGNGLGNLEQRMSKLNGSCRVESSASIGTSIILKLTLPK